MLTLVSSVFSLGKITTGLIVDKRVAECRRWYYQTIGRMILWLEPVPNPILVAE